MIEINLLEALAALQEYGTLSTASSHLHVSQPALSRSMQKLEEELDVQLFERTKNRLTLNTTGKLAASYAKRILELENEMISVVREHDRSLHTLSIGYCAPSPRMEMQGILNELYPDIEMLTAMQKEEELIKGLYMRRYNMIILSHPLQQDDLVCMYYGSEHLYFSVVASHPAARYKDKGVPFSFLDGETFVQVSDVGIWESVKKKMLPHSTIIPEADLDSLNTIINASSLSGFATDITISMFRSKQNRDRIFVPITDPEASMQYYCICLKENADILSRWFDYLKRHQKTFTSR